MLAVEAAVSALSFVVLALLIGHLVAAGFLLPHGEPIDARKSLMAGSAGCLLAFLLVSMIAVVVQGSKLQRGMPSPDVLWRYMTMTQSGNVWVCREIYGVILALVLWKVRGKIGELHVIRKLAVLAVPLIVSRSFMSHAVAVRTDTTVAVAVDMVHLLATSLWAGGVITVWRLLVIGKRASQPVSWSATIVNRFSRLALVCVALLIVTGAYQSWIHVHTPGLLVSTDYGKALSLKLAIFVVMLSYGALNFFSTRRLLRHSLAVRDIGTNAVLKPLQRIRGEAICAVLVYFATGLLTVLPPAVHTVHEKSQRQLGAKVMNSAATVSRQSAEGASIQIVTPENGQVFRGDKVPVQFKLTKGKRGHHAHAYVDGELMGMFESQRGTLTGVKSGKHILELRVVADDHETELDARDTVEFTVR